MPRITSQITMKRFFLLSALFLIPLTVSAANFQAGDTVDVETDGNAYAAGSVVQVSNEVRGDVFLAGETVHVNARIREDAYIAGESVAINAPIGDDLHVFGETIVINDDIRGDLIAFGKSVVISPDSRISGQVIIGAANVEADGWFDRNVRIMAGEAKVKGLFLKDLNLSSSGTPEISEEADIRGDLYLKIQEGKSVVVPDGVVRGEVKRTMISKAVPSKTRSSFLGGLGVFSLLSRIVIGAILIALLRGFAVRYGEKMMAKRKAMWKTLGVGFLVMIVPPFAAIILFLGILTIPLAVLTLLAWGTMLYVAALASGLLVANIFFPVKKTDKYLTMIGKFALGTVILSFVGIIPFAGFFLTFIVYMLSLGALYAYYNKSYNSLRKAHLI